MTRVEVFADREALAREAAESIAALGRKAIAARGHFTWALAGGSTPEPVYRLVASPPLSEMLDWERVHLFWGDERCVPPDDPRSNYRMARESLIDGVPIPEGHVHRMPGELEPAAAAGAYARELQETFADDPPRFDLILLGMGEDGHTASLFPGTAALTIRDRCVVANYVPHLDTWRLTLTYPAINAARHVRFLVAGAEKAEMVARVQEGRDALPAAKVTPSPGDLVWWVDAVAAAELEDDQVRKV